MRQHKSKAKLSRRIGRNLFLKGSRSFSAKDDVSKRLFKPGQHGTARGFSRLSEYGKQLVEKQAIRFTYGLTEKQMRKVFKKAKKADDPTGIAFLTLLETRLDNVVYRGGLANSRSQARQLVNHGHFLVNGIKAEVPSIAINPGDVIEVKPSKAKNAFWTNFKLEIPAESPAWLSTTGMKIKVVGNPVQEELPQEYNLGNIIEYYSRRVK